MTDGEWWRKSGPWSERSGASGSSGSAGASDPAGSSGSSGGGAEDGVYAAPSTPAPAPAPAEGGLQQVSLDLPGVGGPEDRPAAIPPPTVQSSGPWTMTLLDFSDAPQPAPKPIPEQRAAEEPEQAGPAAAPEKKAAGPRRQRKAKAAPAAGGGAKGARKPSPLILLSCGLLVGGAVTGFFPAMLAGWGLGYLSRQLSDLTRKFVILGIPLITMSAATLFAMQHAKQGGAGMQGGSPLGQFSWSMAPGVLRTSAVISAVLLLLLSMRRRPS